MKKKKQNKRSTLPESVCQFCGTDEDNELHYGQLMKKYNMTVHYFCMLFSSALSQKGKDGQGFSGFLLNDVKRELIRGRKLVCSYCKKDGATIGCKVKSCHKQFHLTCGQKNGSLHQFFGQFNSFCSEHRPRQRLDQANNDLDNLCSICYNGIEVEPSDDMLRATCCKNAKFHRECIEKHALSAGVFFCRCPTCNNLEKFQKEMLLYGIYFPERDASWEMEENAYQELYERPNRCDHPSCICPSGREHTDERKWSIELCSYCGSQGCHISCGKLLLHNPKWTCNDCLEIVAQKKTIKPRASSKKPAVVTQPCAQSKVEYKGLAMLKQCQVVLKALPSDFGKLFPGDREAASRDRFNQNLKPTTVTKCDTDEEIDIVTIDSDDEHLPSSTGVNIVLSPLSVNHLSTAKGDKREPDFTSKTKMGTREVCLADSGNRIDNRSLKTFQDNYVNSLSNRNRQESDKVNIVDNHLVSDSDDEIAFHSCKESLSSKSVNSEMDILAVELTSGSGSEAEKIAATCTKPRWGRKRRRRRVKTGKTKAERRKRRFISLETVNSDGDSSDMSINEAFKVLKPRMDDDNVGAKRHVDPRDAVSNVSNLNSCSLEVPKTKWRNTAESQEAEVKIKSNSTHKKHSNKPRNSDNSRRRKSQKFISPEYVESDSSDEHSPSFKKTKITNETKSSVIEVDLEDDDETSTIPYLNSSIQNSKVTEEPKSSFSEVNLKLDNYNFLDETKEAIEEKIPGLRFDQVCDAFLTCRRNLLRIPDFFDPVRSDGNKPRFVHEALNTQVRDGTRLNNASNGNYSDYRVSVFSSSDILKTKSIGAVKSDVTDVAATSEKRIGSSSTALKSRPIPELSVQRFGNHKRVEWVPWNGSVDVKWKHDVKPPQSSDTKSTNETQQISVLKKQLESDTDYGEYLNLGVHLGLFDNVSENTLKMQRLAEFKKKIEMNVKVEHDDDDDEPPPEVKNPMLDCGENLSRCSCSTESATSTAELELGERPAVGDHDDSKPLSGTNLDQIKNEIDNTFHCIKSEKHDSRAVASDHNYQCTVGYFYKKLPYSQAQDNLSDTINSRVVTNDGQIQFKDHRRSPNPISRKSISKRKTEHKRRKKLTPRMLTLDHYFKSLTKADNSPAAAAAADVRGNSSSEIDNLSASQGKVDVKKVDFSVLKSILNKKMDDKRNHSHSNGKVRKMCIDCGICGNLKGNFLDLQLSE